MGSRGAAMSGTLRVLIVDDSETVRERLRTLVDEVGGVHVVGCAGGLREARAALETMRPDVMVLDLRLGDGSGLDLLRELAPSRPAPRVIVLTNEAWPQYRRECLAAGAEWFFDKTTEFHRVPEVLAAAAGSGRAGDRDAEDPAARGARGIADEGNETGARMVAAAVAAGMVRAGWG